MSDLLALAERVERLTGPCRETAEQIAAYMLSQSERYRDQCSDPHMRTILVAGWLSVHGDPTASLDAAMTLVPEGFLWKCGYSRHSRIKRT